MTPAPPIRATSPHHRRSEFVNETFLAALEGLEREGAYRIARTAIAIIVTPPEWCPRPRCGCVIAARAAVPPLRRSDTGLIFLWRRGPGKRTQHEWGGA